MSPTESGVTSDRRTRAVTRRRLLVALAWAVSTLVAIGGGWEAGRRTFGRPENPVEPNKPPTYIVTTGSVERVVPATARAAWPEATAVRAGGDGVITGMRTDVLNDVGIGDILYTVDLYPIVLAQGDVPSFRALDRGTKGADVRQLQDLLIALGYYEGSADGVFGDETRSAVRAWQTALGAEPTGIVPAGAVAVVASLPARLAFDAEVAVGARIATGTTVLHVLESEPKFVLEMSVDQYLLVPEAATVDIRSPNGTWSAVAGQATESESASGMVEVELFGASGRAPCADECDAIPAGPDSTFPATVVIVPTQTGLVVPVSAMLTTPDGRSTVIEADSQAALEIEVLAVDGGLAVVKGLDDGARILLAPGAPASAQPTVAADEAPATIPPSPP